MREVLMLTFPKYQGELPQCLNRLNLRHYWLLAYWLYFRPTALNCYLYQAAPECYQLRGLTKVRRTWRIRAYRNLYLMLPVAVLFFLLLVGLVVGLYLLWTWDGHTASVNAVAMTPNSQQAVSASADGTLRIWDLKSGISSGILQGHTASVNAVAVTPNGQQAVSASADGTLRVWDLKSGTSSGTLAGHTAPLNGVAVTPNGQQAISASLDAILRVWDLKSGTSSGTLEGHTAPVNAVVVTPDGQQAVSGSADGTLKVWDLKSGTSLRTLEGHATPVLSVAVTPDGQQAVSGSANGTLKVWDLKSTQVRRTWKGHTYSVNALAVTPNGQQVISASADGSVRVWDLKSGAEVSLKRAQVRLVVLSLATVMLLSLALINVSVVFAVVLAIAIITFGVAGSLVIGLVGGVVFGLALGTATSLVAHLVTIGNWLNILGFPELGTVSTTTFVITAGIVLGLSLSVASSSVSRRAFGVLGSAIAILVLGVLLGIAIGVLNGVQVPLESATLNEKGGIVLHQVTAPERVKAGLDTGVSIMEGAALLALLGLLGTSRLLFYPFQFVLALRSQLQGRTHPVEWDELTVLPMPGTQRLVRQRLQHDEVAGLALVSEVVRNPFRRAAAQRALKNYLYTQAAPLHLLYKLLTRSDLNAYILAPVSRKDWERLPTTGYLLLGELSGQWTDCSTGWANRVCDRLIWYLTRLERNRRQTPLTRFAGMLYRLVGPRTVNAKDFDLGSDLAFKSRSPEAAALTLVPTPGASLTLPDRSIYTRLTNCPGGVEIERSFDAIASLLSYKELSTLPRAVDAVAELPPEETAIRPTVLKALNRLRDIGSEVAIYIAATSRVNKLAALARATDALKTLNEYVAAEVVAPEQTLLERIIHQWGQLIIEAGGEVGRVEVVEPIANPYIVDHPVTGDLFVGREEVLRHLEELWLAAETCPSVVIYGHRRMGKSSILRNLEERLGTQTTVVDFNMQRVGTVDSTGELLYDFAVAIYDGLPIALQERRGEPNRAKFNNSNPYTALDRFLKQLDRVRAGRRFIVTIDEFELIEQLLDEQRLEPRLLEFWQGIIHTYPWLILAFVGLNTLQEMTQEYWNPLQESVTPVRVSFLSPEAAKHLIEHPIPDFNLSYEPDAVEEIIKLTNGQPYLIQLIGNTLVTRFNHQTIEEGIERERRFTVADVEAVINMPEFFLNSNVYFNDVWVQAETDEVAGQTAILEALSQTGLSVSEIADKTTLSVDRVQAALETLQRHEVVKQQDEQYLYTVELMRRWVVRFLSRQQSS